MSAPKWLPAEFRAEFDRLVADVMKRKPNELEAELLAICAVSMERWRDVVRDLAKQPRDRARIVASDMLLQAAKQFAQGALLLMRDRNH